MFLKARAVTEVGVSELIALDTPEATSSETCGFRRGILDGRGRCGVGGLQPTMGKSMRGVTPMLAVLLLPAVWAQSNETRIFALSGDATTNLALGLKSGLTFTPVLSKPAGETDLLLHAPIRVLNSLARGPFPTIELSGVASRGTYPRGHISIHVTTYYRRFTHPPAPWRQANRIVLTLMFRQTLEVTHKRDGSAPPPYAPRYSHTTHAHDGTLLTDSG